MQNHCVLISGPTVAGDNDLEQGLQATAIVLKNAENCRVESTLADRPIDLVLLEFLANNSFAELKIIQKLKTRYPKLKIVVIADHADREALAEAFACGAQDAFRKPYKTALIVERVKALLNYPE